jgi:hypothetical protein
MALSETWGDMIERVREAGWRLEIEDGNLAVAICPKHFEGASSK